MVSLEIKLLSSLVVWQMFPSDLVDKPHHDLRIGERDSCMYRAADVATRGIVKCMITLVLAWVSCEHSYFPHWSGSLICYLLKLVGNWAKGKHKYYYFDINCHLVRRSADQNVIHYWSHWALIVRLREKSWSRFSHRESHLLMLFSLFSISF